jgi:hypothetical protein
MDYRRFEASTKNGEPITGMTSQQSFCHLAATGISDTKKKDPFLG